MSWSRERNHSYLGLSAIGMNHIDVDTVINEFVKKLFGSVNGLNKDQNRWLDALLDELSHGNQLSLFLTNILELLLNQLRSSIPVEQTLETYHPNSILLLSNDDTNGFFHHGIGEGFHFGTDRGAEQGLLNGWARAASNNAIDLFNEPHLEKFVCFINNEILCAAVVIKIKIQRTLKITWTNQPLPSPSLSIVEEGYSRGHLT